ncbi:hypothetical protein BH10ACI2_BH10ACI2_03020 [soil metagenome]
MSFLRCILLIVIITLIGSVIVTAQSLGSLEVTGRVKIGTKTEKIKRKRFYLLPGGLDANKGLIEKIKAASVTSRDCFYCQLKASPEYIAWLKVEDCESPYCREITADDIKAVPEFQAAYQKGLKQFRGKTDVAQKWVTTNLDPNLRDGYYRQRKASLDALLAGIKPLQSSMTDSVSVRAMFIDIGLKSNDPEGKATEKFLISNLVPIEIGGKGYIWACEKEIGSAKKVILNLQVPEAGKTIPKCEVIAKDLPACSGGTCSTK